MHRRLLVRLHDHFSKIENPTEDERLLLEELTERLPFFHIVSVSMEDLLGAGFDVSNVTDDVMERIAGMMLNSYLEGDYWESLGIIADYCHIPWIDEEQYVLVEFPEDSSPFENEQIGYPCFNSEDNGARYVPIMDYVKHCGKRPDTGLIFSPVPWPESQNYLGHPDKRCEVIMSDENALAAFGSSAVWVPMEVLKSAEPKYAPVLEEVRNKFAAEIAEADANPDKWYEVFVADETGETHSEASGDTFDGAVAGFERIADEWGLEKTSIDIWENRDSPNNILQIK